MAASQDNVSVPTEAHKAHYDDQMSRNAEAGKGLVFALPFTSPYGDFAHSSEYDWSAAAKRDWATHQTVPAKLADLPPSMTLVSYTYHVAKHRRATDGDIRITKADFERMDSAPKATAILWHFSAEYVALIPKPAITFTEAQKRGYRDGSTVDEGAPCLGECMGVGWRQRDMVLTADGTPALPAPGEMTVVSVGELVQSLGMV